MAQVNPDCVLSDLPTLRFLTCGSVDDGKSTLIGRLLWEQNAVFNDQLTALAKDTLKFGTTGEEFDFALLVDGLEAEQQQGITIDVAYRYFRTGHRSFVVADTPGHVQYTRNMATGASNADLAVLLVDAEKGLLEQTRRHAVIVNLLGITHTILAVNKIDLVNYDQDVFAEIEKQFREFARQLQFKEIIAIPLSARYGDNLSKLSSNTQWYRGPSLIEYLERVDIAGPQSGSAFRFPVQWVNRPDSSFRGFSGTIVGGQIKLGDSVTVAQSGRGSRVARILADGADQTAAMDGEAITICLSDEIDISRGDVLVTPAARAEVANEFFATLIWMDDQPLRPGQSYLLKLATQTVPAVVIQTKDRLNIGNLEREPADTLHLNQIGEVSIKTTSPVAFDRYTDNPAMGAFILIDRQTNNTSAAGLVGSVVRRATNVFPQDSLVTREKRATLKGQNAAVIWLTGLSGAGKSTIANLVEARLNDLGFHSFVLDGDNVRHGLSKDLAFSLEDRTENIRRVAEVARLMTDAGLIVICCFISPLIAERDLARSIMQRGEFFEVFVDTPLEACINRDSKGLYRRALAGEIKNFTGISQPYEAPVNAELMISGQESIQTSVNAILDLLRAKGIIHS